MSIPARRNKNRDFGELMNEGRAALQRGEKQLAHNLWREAAMVDPYNEQVWLALLDVLEAPDDRIVCLQNILSINPMNVQARRLLRAYEAEEERKNALRKQHKKQAVVRKHERRVLLRRAILLGMALGLSGILFAIVLSILIYG